MPDGYAITLKLDRYARLNDGGLRTAPGAAFHAVADVSFAMGKDGATRAEGRTLYRDDRPPAAADMGPVRELCQMLD